MKKNIGAIDKIARYVVGILIIGLGLYYQSWWGLIGLFPIAIAAIGYCPPYALFGICTTCEGGSKSCKAPEGSA